ncbi:MAG: 23S rRNA (guanosine(2251)-2'-O)-methyltransferase RlmB, partial [Acetatifactor sp.]|nr:23S rRNA (guanosine(2251)-2'-O)-methyltransferase RlmB [Acetatifactor sp.]
MITSTSNPKVKQIVQWQTKAKQRRQDDVFLAEGLKMFEEAPQELIREVYLTQSLLQHLEGRRETSDKPHNIEEKLIDIGYETVTEEVFSRMSDTRTPQGILTVLRRPVYGLKQLLQGGRPLLVLLEDIQDPGNLGTILRTGEGAGITGVIMSPQTVDIYNP